MKMLHGGGGLEFYNFALGGTNSIQNLYEVIRHREILEDAELIISESSINEQQHHLHYYQKLPYPLMYRNLMWLHKELYFLKKKVLILILPYPYNDYKTINNIYTQICSHFGFNAINMQDYYNQHSLVEFGKRIDAHHQQQRIMREFGKNIIKNIDNFKKPKELNIINDNPKFAICTPKDMELVSGELQEIPMKNSMYDEKTYRIAKNTKLKFSNNLKKHYVIGVHNWNNKDCNMPSFYSSILIKNENANISKEFRLTNLFIEVQNTNFQIDAQTQAMLNFDNINFNEFHIEVQTWNANWKRLDFCDLIAFFLASPNGNYHNETIDFEALANENIQIPKEYDFNHLIPPVELYKEIIDEYCARMDPRKLAPLQKQISEKDNLINSLNQEKQKLEQDKNQQIQVLTNEKNSLQNEKSSLQTQISKLQNEPNSIPTKKANLEVLNLEQELKNKKLEELKVQKELNFNLEQDLKNKKLEELKIKKELGEKFIQNITLNLINANSAKARIQNHLAYKLGTALIENSKSIFGYIRMPFILSYIKEQHKAQQIKFEKALKENPNLALPPLESYADYQEALKEKECFTYKLGEALIKAHKNWYGGGYIKFLLKDVPRLKREFKKR